VTLEREGSMEAPSSFTPVMSKKTMKNHVKLARIVRIYNVMSKKTMKNHVKLARIVRIYNTCSTSPPSL